MEQQAQLTGPSQAGALGERAEVDKGLGLGGASDPPPTRRRAGISGENLSGNEGVERVRFLSEVGGVGLQIGLHRLPQCRSARGKHDH